MGRRPKQQVNTDVAPATPQEDLAIPDGVDAVKVLREIAELNQRVLRAHAKYEEGASEAKDRRERWQGLAEQLQTLIADSTKPSAMPLFDVAEREADQQQMEQGAVPLEDPGLPETPAAQEAVPEAAPEAPTTAPETIYDDDLVF